MWHTHQWEQTQTKKVPPTPMSFLADMRCSEALAAELLQGVEVRVLTRQKCGDVKFVKIPGQ